MFINFFKPIRVAVFIYEMNFFAWTITFIILVKCTTALLFSFPEQCLSINMKRYMKRYVTVLNDNKNILFLRYAVVNQKYAIYLNGMHRKSIAYLLAINTSCVLFFVSSDINNMIII